MSDDGGNLFEEDDELLQQFVEEAHTRLANLTEQLLRLEASGTSPELIASVFREAHTLKGVAGLVGLEHVARVAHAMEDILERVRKGRAMVTADLIDVLLGAADGLGSIVGLAVAGTAHADRATVLERSLQEALKHLQAPPQDLTEPGSLPAPQPLQSGPAGPAPVTLPSPVDVSREMEHERAGPDLDRQEEPNTLQVSVDRLDKLVRLVGESAGAQLRLGQLINQRMNAEPDTLPEFRDLARLLNELQETAMRARMVPVSTITHSLQRAVREVARSTGKKVSWEVRGESTEIDRRVLEQLADPLVHLVRNAVDHGIEAPDERVAAGKAQMGSIRLHAMQLGSEVIIAVTDDGRGIDVARVREEAGRAGTDVGAMNDEEALFLIFRSGLSTARTLTKVSGRGVGLDVVHAQLDAVRGRIEVHTELGKGSEFRIAVPITLAILPCLLVRSDDQNYALPMHSVISVLGQEVAATTQVDGHRQVMVGNQPVIVSSLSTAFGGKEGTKEGPVVVLAGPTRRHAFQVQALIGQRDVVIKGLGRLVPRLKAIAGASAEPDGSILLVLEAGGLIDLARRLSGGSLPGADRPVALSPRANGSTAVPATSKATILVVDDALAVREFQRKILERAGYRVRTAIDGAEGLALLREARCDLVLTDVEMPNLDGFGFTEAVRADPRFLNTPVLILTSRATEEDRSRGLRAGADGYFVKSAFDQTALLGAVESLLGSR